MWKESHLLPTCAFKIYLPVTRLDTFGDSEIENLTTQLHQICRTLWIKWTKLEGGRFFGNIRISWLLFNFNTLFLLLHWFRPNDGNLALKTAQKFLKPNFGGWKCFAERSFVWCSIQQLDLNGTGDWSVRILVVSALLGFEVPLSRWMFLTQTNFPPKTAQNGYFSLTIFCRLKIRLQHCCTVSDITLRYKVYLQR